jgi:hypothetical protein
LQQPGVVLEAMTEGPIDSGDRRLGLFATDRFGSESF